MVTKMIPFEPTHVGVVLQREIDDRQITPQELAEATKLDEQTLLAILTAQQALAADNALRIGQALDIDAEVLMRLQMTYEMDCARIQESKLNCLSHIPRLIGRVAL